MNLLLRWVTTRVVIQFCSVLLCTRLAENVNDQASNLTVARSHMTTGNDDGRLKTHSKATDFYFFKSIVKILFGQVKIDQGQ